MSRIRTLWKQWRCEHFWRPARIIKKHLYWPNETACCKVCDYCAKEVMLTMAEFYAQFGRMPF